MDRPGVACDGTYPAPGRLQTGTVGGVKLVPEAAGPVCREAMPPCPEKQRPGKGSPRSQSLSLFCAVTARLKLRRYKTTTSQDTLYGKFFRAAEGAGLTLLCMARPIILAVDDDVHVLEAVVQDLRRQYGSEYRVMRAASGQAALDTLDQVKTREGTGGADCQRPADAGMTGVEFLERSRNVYPEARRVLLTAYADTEAAIQGHQHGADFTIT